MSNLVSNAVSYADAGSTIRIHVSHDDEHALIAVSNAGEPIAKEHLPRLFHRFYRGDEARGFDANHHGLGLAIVAAIARMHGGRPFAASEGRDITIGFCLSARKITEN